MPKRVIFLDRDGTINVDHGYVSKIEDWKFTPQAPQALKLLQDNGFSLAIITNQSGIARGYYTTLDMRKIHDHMQQELKKINVELDAIAFCPHNRDSTCDCRKPMPGMGKHIEEQIGAIDYVQSWTIGDKPADVGFGQANGTKTVLLKSSYWNEDELTQEPDLIADSLWDAAHEIIKLS